MQRSFPVEQVAPALAFLVHESVPCNGETITAGAGRVARVCFAVAPGYQASGPLTIGRGQWSGNPVDYWPGTIDDVRVFDRALSDAEVAQVYAGDDGEEPELDVTVTAQTRCLAGKAYVAVRATNGEDVPVDVTLDTPFGTKAFSAVAPGANAYQSFAVRGDADGAVEVTAAPTDDADERETVATPEHGRPTCG